MKKLDEVESWLSYVAKDKRFRSNEQFEDKKPLLCMFHGEETDDIVLMDDGWLLERWGLSQKGKIFHVT